jgi:hypothetical protein
MAVARTQTFDQRSAILGRLLVRNRFVAVFRIAVPALGLAAFLALMGQIWLSNLARQYGVSGIRIDRGNLVVETPQYSEIGSDGSRYLVTARDARTPLANPSDIDMVDPRLTFERPGRAPFHAAAAAATVDTDTHAVTVPGVSRIATDDGLSGTLVNLKSNMRAKVTTADGPVDVTFPDGSHLTADNMHFDGAATVWTFEHATLVVPNLPPPVISWTNVFAVFGTPVSVQ